MTTNTQTFSARDSVMSRVGVDTMSVRHLHMHARQRGIVLIASLLLLLVVTILALAMFRSNGLARRSRGNERETQARFARGRARAAVCGVVAELFGEFGRRPPVTCSAQPAPMHPRATC